MEENRHQMGDNAPDPDRIEAGAVGICAAASTETDMARQDLARVILALTEPEDNDSDNEETSKKQRQAGHRCHPDLKPAKNEEASEDDINVSVTVGVAVQVKEPEDAADNKANNKEPSLHLLSDKGNPGTAKTETCDTLPNLVGSAPSDGVVATTSLSRTAALQPRLRTPGAYAYDAHPRDGPAALDLEAQGSAERAATTGSSGPTAMAHDDHENNDLMVSATLVGEEPSGRGGSDGQEETTLMVEAKPAPEGFAAIYTNNRFKYLLAFTLVVFLAVVIPVAVLVPGRKDATDTISCGTRIKMQTDYRGSLSVTKHGDTCQSWDQAPVEYSMFTPERFPAAGLENNNHCRNPDGKEVGVWCFTTNPHRPWDHCDLPFCEGGDAEVRQDCGTLSIDQRDYRGTHHHTNTGKLCQRWDAQFPQEHDYNSTLYPEADLVENFCRNPGGDQQNWCYTTDAEVRWEWCEVPYCKGEDSSTNAPEQVESCFNCTTQSCGTEAYRKADYRGNISVTRTGKTCQRWDLQEPHQHTKLEYYPYGDLVENYCRNPDGVNGPWCLTEDPTVYWEYCTVPSCDVETLRGREDCGIRSQEQTDYRGTESVTASGRKCQRWDSQYPHSHRNVPDSRPSADLEENYCRNPLTSCRDYNDALGIPADCQEVDGEVPRRAWCYTEDPDVRWEYCAVNFCYEEEIEDVEGVIRQDCGTASLKWTDYRGNISKTEDGIDCERWDMQQIFTNDTFPMNDLRENYCRNPNGVFDRAWCPTVDDGWGYCQIDLC